MTKQRTAEIHVPRTHQNSSFVNWQKHRRRGASILAASIWGGILVGCLGEPAGDLTSDTTDELVTDEGLRNFIDDQVGGIAKLMVPATDAELPRPQLPDGRPDLSFESTEAGRYLGKQLFFDPVRTANILPQFGGVLATKQTSSCGSCHLGETASKAGTVVNLGIGGEGRGFLDAEGTFIPRRRVKPGLLDTIPTLTQIVVNGELVATGMNDAVDSVPRLAPTLIGMAFNNRLLQGGSTGEPSTSPGSFNPNNLSAQENITQATLLAHRMINAEAAELQKIPVYIRLFQEAFPDDAARASASNDLNLLVNDVNVYRALAMFLRTVVTRDTPWDRFLAGDDQALTPAQRRGAKLFFTNPKAELLAPRGAGCYQCHGGPMLNKQLGDEAGLLVEENFVNLGLGDHPLQALNASVLGDPQHRDRGRMDVTGNPDHAFKFRVLSLRQLKDGRQYTHAGGFTRVRDVVENYNAGLPQDAEAGAAGTLSPRFANPRGPGSPRGLGLLATEVDDLTDFLENGLYDPGFVQFDPSSPTRTFELNSQDLDYSVYRPDLAALGAVDGRVPSNRTTGSDDALSRRDLGLELLDVTAQLEIIPTGSIRLLNYQDDTYRITNRGATPVDTNLLVIVKNPSEQVILRNAGGVSSSGDPYLREHLEDGVILPGQTLTVKLHFTTTLRLLPRPVTYTLSLLSGQGTP